MENILAKLDLAAGDRVVVAMSGGVDSSATAGLMVEAGLEVIGITLQLYDHGQIVNKPGACCAGKDIYDAKTVADQLGIKHYVLNYQEIFKQNVINDFVDSYLAGQTPIPCVRCNQKVKFKDLLTTAKDLGGRALITGHYARRVQSTTGVELHRAADHKQDQSYFLFTTTPEQLDYLRFPLGEVEKTATRAVASRLGLKVAQKPDSQDICFVPTGKYGDLIKKLRPGALDPGEIVDLEGKVLGAHLGTYNFTVGQRRGLGIASLSPLYVVKIEPENRRVVVGPHEALGVKSVEIVELNWLDQRSYEQALSGEGVEVVVKVRSTQVPVPARVKITTNSQRQDGKITKVHFQQIEYGVAPGQGCVFYRNDQVLGGGWVV